MVTDTPSIPVRRNLSARLNLALNLDFAKKSVGDPGSSIFGEDTYLPAEFSRRYGDLGETLGAGTVARVRSATRKSDGQEVAIKVIASQDEEVRGFAKEEFSLMNSLRHPNIVKVEGLYQSFFCLLMVMELCPAGSLDSHVHRRGVFRENDAVELFQQLLWGLHYLHLKRVVHRDIKPQNLLLLEDAMQERGDHILKITDFNSARRIGCEGGAGLMLSERGTAFYSAPELRFGRIWNERVDVWASGMCFYFMRHGCAPLNIFEPGHAQLLRSGRLPEMNCAGFSDLTRTLLLQCLTVEMRDRPSAMELVLHPLFHEHNDHVSSPARVRARSCEAARHRPSGWANVREEDQAEGSFDFEGTIPFTRQATEPCETMAGVFRSLPLSRRLSAPNAHEWKESRNHSDVAQRLANIRCERALTLNGHFSEAGYPKNSVEPQSPEAERTLPQPYDTFRDLPSPDYERRRAERRDKRAAGKSGKATDAATGGTGVDRYWTTHGACEKIGS